MAGMNTSRSLQHTAVKKFTSAASGYNRAAKFYDDWAWQKFWRANEFPIVLEALLEESPKSVLDIGIGTGAFFDQAVVRFPRTVRLTGVDVSAGMLRRARTRFGQRVELSSANVCRHLSFKRAAFDAVIMMRVANHLPDLDSALSEIARVLAPGGLFIATDLADSFDYVCTSIPTDHSKVHIETYKHTRADWTKALKSRFAISRLDTMTLAQLRQPHAGNVVEGLESENSPVFKIIIARRLAD